MKNSNDGSSEVRNLPCLSRMIRPFLEAATELSSSRRRRPDAIGQFASELLRLAGVAWREINVLEDQLALGLVPDNYRKGPLRHKSVVSGRGWYRRESRSPFRYFRTFPSRCISNGARRFHLN